MSSPQEWLRVGWPVRFDNGREPYVQVTNYDEQALDRLVPAAFAADGLATLAGIMRFALAFEATDKLRHQQDVVRLLLDLAELDQTFSDEQARDAWMSDPKLVPARENIERIFSLNDWAEIIVAIDLAFEPLVGALIKDEFLARNASHNGDPVTPVILAAARRDTARHRAATEAFVRFLVEDPEFGADNHAVIGRWTNRWAAESAAALDRSRPRNRV
jgi:propane monooxygenase small subunit